MLNSLIQTLEALLKCHKQLLTSALEKKKCIIAGNVDELSQLVREEGDIVRQINRLENERSQQVREYLQLQGLHWNEITILQLIDIIPDPEEQQKVRNITKALQDVISELRLNNELNTQLIEDALRYINQSIEVITDLTDELTYGDSVQKHRSSLATPNRNFFDSKA